MESTSQFGWVCFRCHHVRRDVHKLPKDTRQKVQHDKYPRWQTRKQERQYQKDNTDQYEEH